MATRKGKRHRIEFEFWASNYERDSHRPNGADIVVCWENDWESRPKKYRHLEIIDLKSYVGAQPRVFVTGCQWFNQDELDHARRGRLEWNVPSSAQVGDLVLMYRSLPDSEIRDLWKVIGPFQHFGKRNRQDRWPGIQAGLRRLVSLKRPVTFAALKRDAGTRELTIVRMQFRGKSDITDDWPIIYERIVALNPKAKSALRPFLPD